MHLLDNVYIPDEYQPVKYKPKHSVVKHGLLRDYEEENRHRLGEVDYSALLPLCYDWGAHRYYHSSSTPIKITNYALEQEELVKKYKRKIFHIDEIVNIIILICMASDIKNIYKDGFLIDDKEYYIVFNDASLIIGCLDGRKIAVQLLKHPPKNRYKNFGGEESEIDIGWAFINSKQEAIYYYGSDFIDSIKKYSPDDLSKKMFNSFKSYYCINFDCTKRIAYSSGYLIHDKLGNYRDLSLKENANFKHIAISNILDLFTKSELSYLVCMFEQEIKKYENNNTNVRSRRIENKSYNC